MTPARRFALFRILTLLEVVTAIGSAITIPDRSNGGMSGLLLLVVLAHLYVAGFVIAVLGTLAKPRQRLMAVSLAVHVLVGLALLLQWQLQQAHYRSIHEDVVRRRTTQRVNAQQPVE